MKRTLTLIYLTIILLPIGISLYLLIISNQKAQLTKGINNTEVQQQQDKVIDDKTSPNNFTPTSPKIVYEEKPAYENAKYFQKVVNIKEQLTYFTFPLEINPEKPPILIIYNHGSVTSISKNLNDPFMELLQMYAKQFSNNGYAFVASNEHGANYGSQNAINDISNSIEHIKSNYKIQNKVYLIGYSMGGLPTLYYTFNHSSSVEKIALLAPVTYTEDEPNYAKLKDIKIKLWHGNDDNNVSQYASTLFYNYMKNIVKSNKIEYVKIPDATHWVLEPQLIPDIYKFFSTN